MIAFYLKKSWENNTLLIVKNIYLSLSKWMDAFCNQPETKLLNTWIVLRVIVRLERQSSNSKVDVTKIKFLFRTWWHRQAICWICRSKITGILYKRFVVFSCFMPPIIQIPLFFYQVHPKTLLAFFINHSILRNQAETSSSILLS